ncbi:helix-turn-helix domain-containing protein [Actinomadura rugatobispora]|uniref:Helix-turn-helix domain-containing protein n=1 Tax=Actinomadura rugatobispora TaxID=1994 RepID=A0ABW0ZNI5_9ACTN|nr:helix-turn-helix transcriptional regulator [Actinomadura rugatobispora]
MTEPRRSPTLRRRRLSAELTALREGRSLTAVQVDKHLGWTPGKLARMERGVWQRPNPRDITDLLDLYEVTDERRRDYLLTLARQGRERGWWHPYREMLSESYTTYIGLEAEAATILNFEALMVPGLMQTEDYARTVVLNGPLEVTQEQVDSRIAVRKERQELLTRAHDPLRLWAILDEAVLRRQVGGPDVMRAQLQHLLDLAELAKVTVQVVPFTRGAHAGFGGPFVIVEFPEPLDPDAVYSENNAGELLLEDPEDVARFKLAFQRLGAAALSPGDSLAMIAAIKAET